MRIKPRVLPLFLLFILLMVSVVSAQSSSQSADDGLRFLLVRWAGETGKLKNYYDLSKTCKFFEPQLFNDEFFRQYKPRARDRIGPDIITDETVRYGVYQVWRARVTATSDTQKTAASAKDGAYVLIYARNPDWRFAAKRYKVERTASGGQTVTYTDFQDGREYKMELSADWPRAWTVHEIEILSANAFEEIWQASKGPTAEPKK
jgi:hypothetical protein